MTLPVIPISISIAEINGTGVPGAQVALTLTRPDVYPGDPANGIPGALVPATRYLAVCDDQGLGTISAFPNDLGTQGTGYKVEIYDAAGVLLFSGRARVPNYACKLHEVLFTIPPMSQDDGDAAVSRSRDFANSWGGSIADTDPVELDPATGDPLYSARYWEEKAKEQAGLGSGSAAAASTSAGQAAASAASVAFLYPGVYAVAPTTRPPEGTGAAIQAGDRYNNADGFEYAYVGGIWKSDAKNAGLSATSAASSRSAIDNRIYPGVVAALPVTRPDGSPIQAGDRVDLTDGFEYVYINGTWTSAASAAQAASQYAADAQSAANTFTTLAQGELAVTTVGKHFFVRQPAPWRGAWEYERTATGSKFIAPVPAGEFASTIAARRAIRDSIAPSVPGALFDLWGEDAWIWGGYVVPNRASSVNPTLNMIDPFNTLDEVGATPTREVNTTAVADSQGTFFATKVTATAQAQQITFWRSAYANIPNPINLRINGEVIQLGGVSGAANSWRLGNNSSGGTLVTGTGAWTAMPQATLNAFASGFDLGFASATSNTDGVVAIAKMSIYDDVAGETASLPTFAQELASQKAGHMKRTIACGNSFSLNAFSCIAIDGANGAHTINVDPAGVDIAATGFTFGEWMEETEVPAATNAMFLGFDNHALLTNGVSGLTHGQFGLTGTQGANTTGTVGRLGKAFAQPSSSALASTPCPLHYFPNQGLVHWAMSISPNADGVTATQTLWINGVPQILTEGLAWNKATAAKFARMLVGAWNNTTERRKTANPAKGNATGLYFYQWALSDAEMAIRDKYMIAQLRLSGGTPGLRKVLYIFEGDSLTAFSPSWAWHASDCPNFIPRLHAFNVAVGGTGLGGAYYTLVGGVATTTARFAQMIRKITCAALTYDEVRPVIRLGTNEFSGATDPPHPWGNTGTGYAAWRADLVAYIAALKAAAPTKCKPDGVTMPRRLALGAGNLTTELTVDGLCNAYNDDLRNNGVTQIGFDRIIDLGLGTERLLTLSVGSATFASETKPGGHKQMDWRYANATMSSPVVGSANRSPAALLTLSAVAGAAITATAPAGTFLWHDLHRKIVAGALGYGVITAVSADGSTATVDTTDFTPTAWPGENPIVTQRDQILRGGGFDATSYASGTWSIRNNPELTQSDGIHETNAGGRVQIDRTSTTFQARQAATAGLTLQ